MTQIIVIEKDQLQQLIRDEIRAAIAALQKKGNEKPDELLTSSEVAAILKMAPSTFSRRRHHLHHQERFPPPVIGEGKSARWSRKAIEKWQESKR